MHLYQKIADEIIQILKDDDVIQSFMRIYDNANSEIKLETVDTIYRYCITSQLATTTD